ncbi:MAG: hypothetical protein DRI52_11390 [Chloroflexi bacterium]|nr:MAG: hypothetical protein DRI52_11390 [Chloroflexota bacterium]
MEKQYWPAVKERKPNHAYLVWAGFYMGLLSLVNILLAFLISLLPTFLLAITAGAIAILIVWAWRQGLRNSILHVHSVLNMLGGAALGVLAAHWLADQARVIEFLAGFAVMDFISFTRFGKWTLNRKLMQSGPLLRRLSVSLPLPGFSEPYPIIGIGDIFCFALIVGATLQIWGPSFLWMAVGAVGLGQALNVACLALFRHKPWYRSLPTTSFPVLIFILTVLVQNV